MKNQETSETDNKEKKPTLQASLNKPLDEINEDEINDWSDVFKHLDFNIKF